MAAALEYWSGRPSTDEDMIEQVLMKNNDRSEAFSSSSPNPPTKWQRLGSNFAGAVAALKISLNPDSAGTGAAATRPDRLIWGAIVRHLTQLYPGSQLPSASSPTPDATSLPTRFTPSAPHRN